MCQDIQDWTKSNLWKTAFKKFEVKDSLLQILLSPVLNTLTDISITLAIFKDLVTFTEEILNGKLHVFVQ